MGVEVGRKIQKDSKGACSVTFWIDNVSMIPQHIAFCERWEQEHQKRREEEKCRIRRERIDE